MIRIGRVRTKVMGPYSFVRVRRQTVCENGNWGYAVFEFRSDSWINAWVRVR